MIDIVQWLAATDATAVISVADSVIRADSSDSGEGIGFLLLSGPAAGIAFFWATFRRYRNTDKSHRFESDTIVKAKVPVSGSDQKVDRVTGTQRSSIDGDNSSNHRQRVRPLQ